MARGWTWGAARRREPAMRDRTSPGRRVSYDQYLIAVAMTLVRRHRPAWSWRKLSGCAVAGLNCLVGTDTASRSTAGTGRPRKSSDRRRRATDPTRASSRGGRPVHRLSRVVVTPCPVPVLAGGMGYQPTGPRERRPGSRRCAVTAHGPACPSGAAEAAACPGPVPRGSRSCGRSLPALRCRWQTPVVDHLAQIRPNPARKPQPKRVRRPTRSPCRLPDANRHGSEKPGERHQSVPPPPPPESKFAASP